MPSAARHAGSAAAAAMTRAMMMTGARAEPRERPPPAPALHKEDPGFLQRQSRGPTRVRLTLLAPRRSSSERHAGWYSDSRIFLLPAPSRPSSHGQWLSCGFRPRLQRRDRDGFSTVFPARDVSPGLPTHPNIQLSCDCSCSTAGRLCQSRKRGQARGLPVPGRKC